MPLIPINNRYTGEAIYSSEATSLRECLENAIKDDAYLGDAYLGGADLRGDVKVEQQPIQIDALKYYIFIFDQHMKIDCKLHSLSDWWGFDDRRIIEMDGKQALEWWRKWKPILQAVCETEGRS